MTKKNKKILSFTLCAVVLALIVIPIVNSLGTSAATWVINSCYVTKSEVPIKSSASSSSTTLTTIPANTYIYVIGISGSWGKTAYNGKKGYVDISKATRKDGSPETSGEVEKRLEAIQRYFGNGDVWKGSLENNTEGAFISGSTTGNAGPWQCFGFASEVWRTLFGCEMARAYRSGRVYELVSDSDMKLVGQLRPASYNATHVKTLLSKARPGDILQACSGTTGTSGQHTMIVDSVGADGIYIYDANANGTKNGIRQSKYYTWQQMYSERRGGMSLYTYVNYPAATVSKVIGGAITVKNSAGNEASVFYLQDKINFSANVSNATEITYYICEKSSNKVVKSETLKNKTNFAVSYIFSALTSNSTEYYIYYKASNSASSATSGRKAFTVQAPSVSISGGALTLFVGKTHTLTATKLPSSATVAWTSSNANVATINANGVITAKAAGTVTITATLSYKATGGLTVRATAQKSVTVKNQTFTATLNPNGGTVSPSSITIENTKTYGALAKLPTPTRKGYTFAGWYTAASGSTRITDDSKVSVTANITLYAHWTAKKYTVTFNPNGNADELGNKASVNPASQNVTYDSAYGTLSVPVWPGHTFDGWYTAASGGTKITSATIVKITAAQTLYAHWTISSFTVTFNANGGSTSTATKTVKYIALYGELPTPTRTGYTFDGWYTAVSGGTKVTKDSKVTITANTTLYAHWTANKYSVNFNANGGSLSSSDSKTVTYDAAYGTLPIPTRKGYSFVGWFTDAKGGNRILAETKVTITSKQTLYAHWEPGSYRVSFNANGGVTATESKFVTYLTTYGTLPVPTRTGYTFDGWYTAASGGTKIVDSTPVNITEDQTLHAHWKVNTYKVSFETGSKESTFASKNVTFDTPYGTLPVPTRTGYTFAGWYTDKTAGELIKETSILKIGSDSILYARWTPNKYNIRLDVNGGDSASVSISVSFELPYGNMPTPVKHGYVFEGWYTEATGGKLITSESIVENPFDITLYAHWSAKKIKLTFDAAGGKSSLDSKIVEYDRAYGELPSAERTGYTFICWKTKDGKSIFAGDVVSLVDDCTLVAEWEALKFTIGFDTNGGLFDDSAISIGASAEKVVAYDGNYPELYTPYRYGYRFIGWKTKDGNYAYSGDIVKITSSQKLVADWVPLSVKVTFDTQGGDIESETITVEYASAYGKLPVPVKEGYTFKGWLNDSGRAVTDQTTVLIADNHTLTASWEANEYTLRFVSNSDADYGDEKRVKYDSAYGELPVPERTGYKFINWTDSNGNTVFEDDIVKITSDMELIANWSPMFYEITFDGKGAKTVIPPMLAEYDSVYGELPTIQRPGYIFDGWYINEEQITEGSSVKITSDSVAEAKWIAIVYDVIFNHNGGKCSVDNMDFTCDQLYSALPEITRTGYNFAGWFNEEGNQVTENMAVRPVDKLVFTAHWTPVKYNVYFSINDVIDTSLTMEVEYNSTYGELPTIDAAGYKFMYWTDENGERVNSDDVYTFVSDKTLYAAVNMNKFNITFYADGGKPEYSHMDVYYNDKFGKLPESVKMGYMFAGWYTKDGMKVTEDTVARFTEDTTLYARWIEIESNTEAVFNGNGMLVTGCEVVAAVNVLILAFTSLRKRKKRN